MTEEDLSYQAPFSLNNLKNEQELYKEEDDINYRVINVKRINLPRKGEKWELLENGKVVLVLPGTRFSNKQKNFLKTPAGMLFLINGFKQGWKSVSKFKSEMF